ncbi:hypothetical protein P4640_19470, partial [Priestia aryabhattai]|uniref:hypothetical protein n=2 Tax=Priestia TaxID=2800373 RepID=UPI002E1E013B|nr:hypothetical protein [Priestia aryabhattai]
NALHQFFIFDQIGSALYEVAVGIPPCVWLRQKEKRHPKRMPFFIKTVDAVHHLPKGSPFGMASTNAPTPLDLRGGSLAGWRQTNEFV